MRAVVLCYHSNNIHGNDYGDNDHVALAQDLRTIHALGLSVRSLHAIVDELDHDTGSDSRSVAISFDDGSWFDWHDLEHPTCGMQRSFSNVLLDFQRASGTSVHATSFVIASAQAREELDRTCLIGRGWWGEDWWAEAARSRHLAIESHSWDHQHETLVRTATGLPGGTFRNIHDHAAADIEVRRAADYLDAAIAPRRSRLFAYPYGEYSDYLVEEYFPRFRHQHRVDAAFGTAPEPVGPGSDRWRLGRYVCGHAWKSPDDLARLLRDALG